jgi:photosystem II stability/assembly factor-like uncharacterized protein
MKKLIFTLPILFLFLHLMYGNDGPGIWTLESGVSGNVWQKCIAINPTNQQTMYTGTNGAGVFKTTNGGLTWAASNTGLTNLGIFSLEISTSNPSILYAGTIQSGTNPGIYKSTDAAATWTRMINGITESSIAVAALAIDPTNPNVVYTAIFDGLVDASTGIFKTTDGGSNWFASNTGIGTIKNFLSIVINPLNPNVVYIGSSFGVVSATGPEKIYKSNNAGATWVDMSTGLPQATTDVKPVRCLSISNTDTAVVLAGLFNNTDPNGGAYLTTNGGASWARINTGLPNNIASLPRACLIRPGSSTEFYMGYDNANTTLAGVYRTVNRGVTWVDFNGGTMNVNNAVRALAFRTSPDSTIFAGVSVGATGVHEYTIIPVGIHSQNGNIPTSFALYQNFPNPFNPATYIQYDVLNESYVTLKVYDIGGREIKSLVNEMKQAGTYQILFDASSLTSGVYFYTIKAGDFVETKKMMLVK